MNWRPRAERKRVALVERLGHGGVQQMQSRVASELLGLPHDQFRSVISYRKAPRALHSSC
jgi:hypothetical protein